jgi:hypothetical protein
MTTTAANRDYLEANGNTRDTLAQADAEGRALRGEFGPERQITAMSALYLRLREAGKHHEAATVKAQAQAIRNAAAQQEA